jgi:hypothetical protein
LTSLSRGCGEGEQPLLSKESVRPAVVISASGSAFALLAVAQDASKAHSDPLVQLLKEPSLAVLEILKPASLDFVQFRDRLLEAVPIGTLGLDANLVLELPQALFLLGQR